MAGSKGLFFLMETIMKIQIGGWRGRKGGLLLAVVLTGPVVGQQTGDECTGMVPLVDMARGDAYQGFQGGLYLDVKDYNWGRHLGEGMKRAMSIRPLDASGAPARDGKIVFLSIGMSNTSQESNAFASLIRNFQGLNPAVVFVNGAQGGQDARRIADPDAPYWTNIDQRLAQLGLTPLQVQVIWHLQAVANPRDPFPDHAQELRDLNAAAARIIKDRYPHTGLMYSSSRIYAGYAKTGLNPEPYAYESGFSVKWLIEDQIAGDPELNYDPRRGEVRAPYLQWAAYLWADGVCGREDGLQWFREDFAADGTHPSAQGARKVADLLLAHFSTDPTARLWFLRPALRVVLGDMNGNGRIDGPDAHAFLLYEVDPDEFARRYPDVDPIAAGDINQDGTVNNNDLLEFIPVLIAFSEP